MSSRRISWALFAGVGLALLSAGPATGDVTVQARYLMPDSSTLERTNYYAGTRARITSFDGREYMYDSKSKQLTVIDHTTKRYWSGPIAEADSIVARLNSERDAEFRKTLEGRQEELAKFMDEFNESIAVEKTEERRRVAGFACDRWKISAGSHIVHERWVASGFTTERVPPDLDRVLMAGALDPFGRALVGLLLQGREIPGMTLAATTTYKTPTQTGTYSWEATRVTTGKIPARAWELPEGYERVTF